jgi:FMN-dependent NADH-azoreductase
MTDKSTQLFPDPATMDFYEKANRWFEAQGKYIDCHFGWWGLKSLYGICDEKKLKGEATAAETAVKDAEKRLHRSTPKP